MFAYKVNVELILFSVHFKSIVDKTASSVNVRCKKLKKKQYSEFEIKYLD